MANSELYCNDPGTTLSAAITSTSATSLTVTSGTGYPSSGNFRIKIDSELMLVTAVSGTTWTITRGIEGTTAATHLSSAPVNAYFTAGGLDAIRTNISSVGTYANLPSAPKQGDRYQCTDIPYGFVYDGTNWQPFNSWPGLPPTLTYSWFNQSTTTETVIGGGAARVITNPSSNFAARVVPVPGSTPWTCTIGALGQWAYNTPNYFAWGAVILDGSNNWIAPSWWDTNGYWNIFTSGHGTPAQSNSSPSQGLPRSGPYDFIRLNYNGTTLSYSMSTNGLVFSPTWSGTLSTYIGSPAKIGVFVNVGGGSESVYWATMMFS